MYFFGFLIAVAIVAGLMLASCNERCWELEGPMCPKGQKLYSPDGRALACRKQ